MSREEPWSSIEHAALSESGWCRHNKHRYSVPGTVDFATSYSVFGGGVDNHEQRRDYLQDGTAGTTAYTSINFFGTNTLAGTAYDFVPG